MPETWTTLEKLMQDVNIHSSPETAMDAWKHSIPRFPEVTDSLECSTDDIDWHMQMLPNPSMVDSRVEMPLKLLKEEDDILESISPTLHNQCPHCDG